MLCPTTKLIVPAIEEKAIKAKPTGPKVPFNNSSAFDNKPTLVLAPAAAAPAAPAALPTAKVPVAAGVALATTFSKKVVKVEKTFVSFTAVLRVLIPIIS